MIISIVLIIAVAFWDLDPLTLFMLFVTWVPDIVITALIFNR